jgi:hypothetical protein
MSEEVGAVFFETTGPGEWHQSIYWPSASFVRTVRTDEDGNEVLEVTVTPTQPEAWKVARG